MNQSHARLMQSLAQRHEALAALLHGRRFDYVDIPVHGNVGDLLIYLGTLAFFARYGVQPQRSVPYCGYAPDWPADTIVFHGGGNLGDLYTAPQALRERTIAARPDCRIIILPQTIHFEDRAAFERACAVFRSHPDLHLCVRDTVSEQLARQMCDNVYLLPDMAHQLYPLPRPAVARQGGRLAIQRVDDESGHVALAADRITDWPELVGPRRTKVIRAAYHAFRLANRAGLGRLTAPLLAALWQRYAARLVDDAIALYGGYDEVVTDRLHGHILACLLDKPHRVLDNRYGKNSRYIDAWTGASPLLTLEHRA